MDNEEHLVIEDGLSVGTMKIANKYEMFTEKEVDAINNKIPELDERVGIVEDEIEENKNEIRSKRIQGENTKDDTKGTFDSSNFAGQDLGENAPIGNVMHHYTDGIMFQLDNIGENNKILILKNAVNPICRPDKPSNFSGTGDYIVCVKQNGDTKENFLGFVVNKDFGLWWSGTDGNGNYNQPTKLSTNKDANGVPAFIFESYKEHPYFARFLNGGKVILDIRKNGTRLELVNTISGGIYIETPALRFRPTNGTTEFIGDFRVGDGSSWNYPQYITSGTTAQRPTITRVGQQYFDTDLNMPIWRNKSNNGWVDSNGLGV